MTLLMSFQMLNQGLCLRPTLGEGDIRKRTSLQYTLPGHTQSTRPWDPPVRPTTISFTPADKRGCLSPTELPIL